MVFKHALIDDLSWDISQKATQSSKGEKPQQYSTQIASAVQLELTNVKLICYSFKQRRINLLEQLLAISNKSDDNQLLDSILLQTATKALPPTRSPFSHRFGKSYWLRVKWSIQSRSTCWTYAWAHIRNQFNEIKHKDVCFLVEIVLFSWNTSFSVKSLYSQYVWLLMKLTRVKFVRIS